MGKQFISPKLASEKYEVSRYKLYKLMKQELVMRFDVDYTTEWFNSKVYFFISENYLKKNFKLRQTENKDWYSIKEASEKFNISSKRLYANYWSDLALGFDSKNFKFDSKGRKIVSHSYMTELYNSLYGNLTKKDSKFINLYMDKSSESIALVDSRVFRSLEEAKSKVESQMVGYAFYKTIEV